MFDAIQLLAEVGQLVSDGQGLGGQLYVWSIRLPSSPPGWKAWPVGNWRAIEEAADVLERMGMPGSRWGR